MHEAFTTCHSRHSAAWLVLLAATIVPGGAGCTSVIGSAYLREAWLDAMEHAADEGPRAGREATQPPETAEGPGPIDRADGSEAIASDDAADTDPTTAGRWSPASLAEAITEADRRLADVGGLAPAARDALTATLEATPRQDWLIVIDEFTAALLAAADAAAAAPPPAAPPASAPAAPPAPAPEATVESPPTTAAAPVASVPAAPAPSADPPVLAIHNACFASRVRAWSVVDRFEAAEFRPGQDVIVYFELDQLATRSHDQGHTTRVETALRLVDADGHRLHEWSFEPLEETCGSRRRDYFARYLVTIPLTARPGHCRLEIAVTDAIGGRTAHTSLPLELVGR